MKNGAEESQGMLTFFGIMPIVLFVPVETRLYC